MNIEEVFHFAQQAYHEAAVVDIIQLPQAGSDRQYYRIHNGVKRSIIATYSPNVAENERFIALSLFFDHQNIPVPQILAVHPSKELYLQTDVGKQSLLDLVMAEGYTPTVFSLYQKSLKHLVDVQLCAFDPAFNNIFQQLPSFGYEQLLYDVNYFRQQFLVHADLMIDEDALQKEFEQLAHGLQSHHHYFMYRDFQGRNIMIQDEDICFIDFQGGMQGHPMYDVSSLLWQAKAALPVQWKQELLAYYIATMHTKAASKNIIVDTDQWQQDYQLLTLVRLLQVLGAYGLRGITEGKAHFKSSIPMGLANIDQWLKSNSLAQYPVLEQVLKTISQLSFISQFPS